MAYDSTSVTVERSQGQIRQILQKFAARAFAFREARVLDEGEERRVAIVEFIHDDHHVRILVPLKPPDTGAIAAKAKRARVKTFEVIQDEEYEQEERRIWRVLYWTIKARMVTVEEEVETFEQAFLAHLVDPSSGRTLYERLSPAIEAGEFRVGGAGLRALPVGGED